MWIGESSAEHFATWLFFRWALDIELRVTSKNKTFKIPQTLGESQADCQIVATCKGKRYMTASIPEVYAN